MSSIQSTPVKYRRIHALMHRLSEQTDIPVDQVSQLLTIYESLRPYPLEPEVLCAHDYPVPHPLRPAFAHGLGDLAFGAHQLLEIMGRCGLPAIQADLPGGGYVAVLPQRPEAQGAKAP